MVIFKGNKCPNIVENIERAFGKSGLLKNINDKLSRLNVIKTPRHFLKKFLL